jgi:hypothetical protein
MVVGGTDARRGWRQIAALSGGKIIDLGQRAPPRFD